MVNALVGLERKVKEIQHRLVVCDIGLLEGGARRFRGTRGVPVDRPFLATLPAQGYTGSRINVANAYVGVVFTAKLDKTSADTIGTSCSKRGLALIMDE